MARKAFMSTLKSESTTSPKTLSQASSETKEAKSNDVRGALRTQNIDRYIIESILDSYLHELAGKDVVVCNEMMGHLETNPAYVNSAHRVVFDGLMISTLAATVDDTVFEAALEEIEPIDAHAGFGLEGLRQAVFDGALACACQSVGGSPTHGKFQRRAQQFKAVCQA